MTEVMEEGNLISKTQAFLSFAIFSSWHDTIAIYRSCENLSSWPHKLRITRRRCKSIAWKVCIDAHTIRGSLINNNDGINNSSHLNTAMIESWWIEDVSILRIDHFIEVISAIKAKGMNLKLMSACIMHWAAKSFWEIEMRIQETKNNDHVHASAIECLIRVLPRAFVSFKFLLRLLKLGLILNISQELVKEIEKEVVEMLESCSAGDLVVKNYGVGYDISISCDVNLVRRVVENYITFASCNAELQKMAVVAGTVDANLTMVAREDNLSVETFLSLAEAFPKSSRLRDDSIYMAIDTYLKARPSLTEEERKRVCSAMEYQKLSLEACMHLLQNERLPLSVTIRYLLVEQVVLARSLSLRERLLEAHEELGIMKEQVMEMKARLSDLHIGRAELNEIARQKSNHPCNSRRKTT